MKLSELLEEVRCSKEELYIAADTDVEVTGLAYDSREEMKEGTLFACFKGHNFDGHDHAAEAVEKGARVLLVDRPLDIPKERAAQLLVPDVRYFFAFLAAAFYGNPAEKMKVIGLTGTKGKTTSTFMLQELLNESGHTCGLIGTVQVDTHGRVIPADHTTPEALQLQEYFREMVDNGCDSVVMEVSSLALKMHRTQGFLFDIGVFTNLTPDHIGGNEHEDFEEYKECKKMLFRQSRVAIGNTDDPYCYEMLEDCPGMHYLFAIDQDADLRATDLKPFFEGGKLGMDCNLSGIMKGSLRIALPGRFSVYNAMTAILPALLMGVGEDVIRDVMGRITVRGRIEMVPVSKDYTLMVDYAHNAVALESLLVTLRAHEPHRLVTLFGCGGNRDKKRRFEMGEVSGRLSDLTVITSDNPRFEEPEAILDDIETGIKPTGGAYVRIADRKEAIRYAILNAEPGDIIVLAGKGHEPYQEIKGVKYHMDERELVRQVVEEEHIS